MRPRSLFLSPLVRLALAVLAVIIIILLVAASSSAQPAFNQQTNASYGNEHNFIKIRDINSAANQRTMTVKPGEELAITVYFDNNASKSSQAATGSQVKISLLSSFAKAQIVRATINANNTDPKTVSDSIELSADQPIGLSYETGSARLWNNTWRGQSLSDSLVGGGATIGYDKLDGNVPGGVGYSGYVTIKVMVAGQTTNITDVPNTGPGDVIAIFIAASLLAGSLHYAYSLRRASF